MRCDCGKEVIVFNHAVRCGNNKSCGCRIQRVNPDSALIRARSQIESNARSRRLEYSLTDDELSFIWLQACVYCETLGGNQMRGRNRGRSTMELLQQYNGLDRVDSNLGYVAGNVVPCCRWCNQAKSSRPVGEFLTWLRLFGCTKTEKSIKLAASEIAREVATHGGKQQALRFRPAKGVSAQHELTENHPQSSTWSRRKT